MMKIKGNVLIILAYSCIGTVIHQLNPLACLSAMLAPCSSVSITGGHPEEDWTTISGNANIHWVTQIKYLVSLY